MEKIDLVLWMMGAGFAIMFSLTLIMWNYMNSMFEKMDARFEKLEVKIEKLDDKIKNLERDMIEVKTILRMKECCMIQDERHMKKAE
jgi:uncharacterized protein YdcH (DUF465 family)